MGKRIVCPVTSAVTSAVTGFLTGFGQRVLAVRVWGPLAWGARRQRMGFGGGVSLFGHGGLLASSTIGVGGIADTGQPGAASHPPIGVVTRWPNQRFFPVSAA